MHETQAPLFVAIHGRQLPQPIDVRGWNERPPVCTRPARPTGITIGSFCSALRPPIARIAFGIEGIEHHLLMVAFKRHYADPIIVFEHPLERHDALDDAAAIGPPVYIVSEVNDARGAALERDAVEN